jgi:hypothetical protein
MISTKKSLMFSFVILSLIFVFILIFSFRFYSSDKESPEADKLIKDNVDIINRPYYEASSDLRPIDDTDTIWGDPNAEIQIILYEDLSDLYSYEFNQTLNSIKDEFSDDIVIAFRPYVTKAFSLSRPTRLFVECAKEQERFFEARDLILEKAGEGSLSVDSFPDYANELALDFGEMDTCFNDDEKIERIEYLSNEAKDFGVYGSPSTFVNQEMVLGARPLEDVSNGQGEFLPGMKNIVSSYLN